MISTVVTTGIRLNLRNDDVLPVVHTDMIVRGVKYSDMRPDALFAIAKKIKYEDWDGHIYISEDLYKLTYEFGFLAAAYLGDNRVSNCKDLIKFYSRNTLHLDYLREHAATAGFIPVSMYKKDSRSKLTGITIRSENVCNWFRIHFNNPNKDRELPDWVYHSPEAFRRGLIDGLICSDGSVNGTKGRNRNVPVLYIMLVSEELAERVILLLKTLGIGGTIIRWKPTGRMLYPVYGVNVNILDLHGIRITDTAKKSFIQRTLLDYAPRTNSSDLIPWNRAIRREIIRVIALPDSALWVNGGRFNISITRLKAKQFLKDYPQVRDVIHPLVRRWVRWVDSKTTQFVKIKNVAINDEPLLYKSYLDRIIGIHNEEEMDLTEI